MFQTIQSTTITKAITAPSNVTPTKAILNPRKVLDNLSKDKDQNFKQKFHQEIL